MISQKDILRKERIAEQTKHMSKEAGLAACRANYAALGLTEAPPPVSALLLGAPPPSAAPPAPPASARPAGRAPETPDPRAGGTPAVP